MKLDLRSFEKFFKEQDFDCKILPPSEDLPREYLFVHLGTDSKDRDLILQINLTKQQLDLGDKIEEIAGNIEALYHLQLMVQLPYSVKMECIGDLSRFLLLLNKSSDIPGLEFSETDRTLFWRHVMILNGTELDPYVLITLLGTIFLTFNVFGPFIESVSCGEKSLQRTVEDIRELQQKIA